MWQVIPCHITTCFEQVLISQSNSTWSTPSSSFLLLNFWSLKAINKMRSWSITINIWEKRISVAEAVLLRTNDWTDCFKWGIVGIVFTAVRGEGHGHFLGVHCLRDGGIHHIVVHRVSVTKIDKDYWTLCTVHTVLNANQSTETASWSCLAIVPITEIPKSNMSTVDSY